MTARGRNGLVTPTRRWKRSESRKGETIVADYTLQGFVKDLDAITSGEADPVAITTKAAPLLARLCRNPEAIPVQYRALPASTSPPSSGDLATRQARTITRPGAWWG